MTASAWLRSMRPLRKALCVNSPGSAGRHPRREEVREDLARDEGAAMAGDLERVLARVGVGPSKRVATTSSTTEPADVDVVAVGGDPGRGSGAEEPSDSLLYQGH
jgi:hypothetical protein